MKSEEGELPSSRRTGDEDVRAEELHQTDGARERAPRSHDHEQELRFDPLAQDQHDGGGEQCVLEELRGRDGVARARVAARAVRDEDLDTDPDEVERRRDPEREASPQRREPAPDAGDDGGDDDGEDGEVGQLDTDGGRARRDAELRLVAQVDEEDRKCRGKNERLGAHAAQSDRRALAQRCGRRSRHGGESSDPPP